MFFFCIKQTHNHLCRCFLDPKSIIFVQMIPSANTARHRPSQDLILPSCARVMAASDLRPPDCQELPVPELSVSRGRQLADGKIWLTNKTRSQKNRFNVAHFYGGQKSNFRYPCSGCGTWRRNLVKPIWQV